MVPGGLEPLDVGTIQIPYHFRCPISLELMRDPVTVCTGQTYDRSSIESWVAAGHTTCPVTRAALSDPVVLIPNHTLRRLIQDWCVAHRSAGVQRIPTPKQPADPSALRSLLLSASSSSAAPHSRLSALRRLRSLARDSEKNRCAIAALDARHLLLGIAFSSAVDLDSPELSRESIAILSLLPPLAEDECAAVASDPARIARLASLLSDASIEVRVNAAALMEAVAAGSRSADDRAAVSGAEGAFEGIVELLRWPVAYPRALRVGVRALFALCLAKQSRGRAVAAGAAEALVERLAELERGEAERALATVELLSRVPEGCEKLAAHALTVPLLVKTILKVSERATEYAAGALLALCSAAERSQREAVAAGVLTQLLLLVQSDCTERAKRKAQLLLKLLRDSWPEDSIAANSDDFGCSGHV